MLDFGVRPLLDALSSEVRAEVMALSSRRTCADGQLIQQAGDIHSALFIIEQGAVRMCQSAPDGVEITIIILGAGQSFGDLTLLEDKPRAFDASAIGKTQLLELRRSAFDALWEKYPSFGKTMLSLSAQRLHITLSLLDDMRRLDLNERCAKLLLEMTTREGRPATQVDQATLSQVLGVSRVSIGRALGFLKAQGLINTGYGEVEVIDPQALNAWLTSRIGYGLEHLKNPQT
ncbi:Crp/Fnr family transcriptional regulator [Erythrobacter sanguineus]|uniref:cAMP-binding domain of CRP or a regulatory subunit of cAMP-dependent protein kinases n=1 Tax=Erythrobacter sanguineus TaxID=198312 RepID=A0A1M7SZP7_9SPHN|nr:Crp/Fnr family transcriptional regulator [Erythrobacter sanguineus]SHN63932.1 cAMP-binding domain of CRP or a regulatory subunit of cAMP-dependent protein kinases [Erythrobacter sanguineus]